MENLKPTIPSNYIEADAATFKDVVQKLTGGSAHKLRPRPTVSRRRKHLVRDLDVIRLGVESALTPPVKTLMNVFNSPVTQLGCDSVLSDRAGTESPPSEEERVADKGFYMHASPGRAAPPVLLNLFPVTSPETCNV